MSPDIIKDTRQKRGMSQEALADLLGIDQGTVSRIERNELAPSKPVQKLLEQFIAGDLGPSEQGVTA